MPIPRFVRATWFAVLFWMGALAGACGDEASGGMPSSFESDLPASSGGKSVDERASAPTSAGRSANADAPRQKYTQLDSSLRRAAPACAWSICVLAVRRTAPRTRFGSTDCHEEPKNFPPSRLPVISNRSKM
jgi:hypothetical protein